MNLQRKTKSQVSHRWHRKTVLLAVSPGLTLAGDFALSEAATGSNISAKRYVRHNELQLYVLEQVTRAELSILKHGVNNGQVPVHVPMGRIPGYVTCIFLCYNIFMYVVSNYFWVHNSGAWGGSSVARSKLDLQWILVARRTLWYNNTT